MLKDLLAKNKEDLAKYLEELIESIRLDDFINTQNFKFRNLGYKFTHTKNIAKDNVIDVSMYLIDKKGERVFQGMSDINNGVLENVFNVSIQQQDISTAMYKLLEKIGFKKVIGHYYGNGSLNVNYLEFIKVFNETNDEIKAAYSTPAGKALNKALNNKFKPVVVQIDKTNKKVIVNWIKNN